MCGSRSECSFGFVDEEGSFGPFLCFVLGSEDIE